MKNFPWYGYLGILVLAITLILALTIDLFIFAYSSGFLLIFLALNKNSKKSLLSIIKKSKTKVVIMFVYFMILGLVYEVVGRIWLKKWVYPTLDAYPYFWIVLILSWVAYGFLVYETFILINRKVSYVPTFFLTVIIHMVAFEFLNLFSKGWVYIDISPILWIVFWFITILVFYVIPNKLRIF